MPVQLNHTIVWCRDKRASAAFLTRILGLPEATPFGPMLVVPMATPITAGAACTSTTPTATCSRS